METRGRVLCYLFLALVCYTLAASVSMFVSVMLFLGIGGIAELLMWFNLFNRHNTNAEPK